MKLIQNKILSITSAVLIFSFGMFPVVSIAQQLPLGENVGDELVGNGAFDANPGIFSTGASGDTKPAGWTSAMSGWSIYSTPDINVPWPNRCASSISQSPSGGDFMSAISGTGVLEFPTQNAQVKLIKGAKYKIKFDYANFGVVTAQQYCLNGGWNFQIINGANVTVVTTSSSSIPFSSNWNTHEYEFIATQNINDAKIRILPTHSGTGQSGAYMSIDGVSLTVLEIPPPNPSALNVRRIQVRSATRFNEA